MEFYPGCDFDMWLYSHGIAFIEFYSEAEKQKFIEFTKSLKCGVK